jgi:ASPIC and UnbV/FG-GAP-like repeat
MKSRPISSNFAARAATLVAIAGVLLVLLATGWSYTRRTERSAREETPREPVLKSSDANRPHIARRMAVDEISGFSGYGGVIRGWSEKSTLEEVAENWRDAGSRGLADVDRALAADDELNDKRVLLVLKKASLLNSEGEPEKAYRVLEEFRPQLVKDPLYQPMLGTLTYFEGLTALRRGENDNCILCRGESSCIVPIAPAALHTDPTGSRLAIKHFSEYLAWYPDDLDVRWLLNLAHMTLGEYPDRVDPRYRLDLDRFIHSEFDIGKFRDIGHLVGVNRFNQAGGAIMEDFDNDGLLDLVVTSFDPTVAMAYYRNKGDGTFEDQSATAGVTGQLGGLVCYQTDYDNDGRMDIFVARGAWLPAPIRPSLLHNDGGSFSDVTQKAGLSAAVNSNGAAWADYDNDGWLDLFIGCERQPHRLYHNHRDGTFEEVAAKAGLQEEPALFCKGCTWIDHDNDDYPDLFIDHLNGVGRLYHNNRDGTFVDVSAALDIDGPRTGFSCWAWDYDNDGWLDIFATSYDYTLGDVVKGMMGHAHNGYSNRLFRNVEGKRFENVVAAVGLDSAFATMGSNFADFDNDGWLDFYLGTGGPQISVLVPNRMFKNVDGRRFAEITASSGTGHLQKGHAVACGDWDRDGDIDLFVETGGAINGDRYHNILFQNPGQGNHWLTLKLAGKQTNRAAIGARIKVVTAGENPLTIHRHVSSGSSFGANPLEQTIGLGKATRVARLEIRWPVSRTTQVFHDIAADQAISINELAESYQVLHIKPLAPPPSVQK